MEVSDISVLLIDDDPDDFLIVQDYITEIEYIRIKLEWVKTYEEGVAAIEEKRHNVYLIDYKLGAKTGLELLENVQDLRTRNCIFIILTGQGSMNLDVNVMQLGADDFLSKNELNATLLSRSIRYGLERKKTYIELQKSQNQYKQIYLTTKTPVIEVDLDMNVLKVNRAFNETFKYTEEFVITPQADGPKVWDLLDCETTKELVIEHIYNKKERSAEIFECNNQQKKVLLVQMNVYELIDAEGEYTYQIVLNDLTEKIKHDKAKNKQEKLDLMEKMARIVAHEVRNPLTNIILSCEQLAPIIPEDKKLYTDIIKRNSSRIETLIRKFLNTFKNIDIKKDPHDIADLMKECIADIQDKAQLLGVKIESKVPSRLTPFPIDRDKIRLVFVNILNNAVQACDRLDNAAILITAEVENDFLKVEIADNGVGIPEEDISKLFEPFFTKKNNGLGLGLTTSLNILSGHNGKITAKNNNSGGATFTVCIPYLHNL